MKIRIECDDYNIFSQSMRDRVGKSEFPSWRLESFDLASGKKVGRLVYHEDDKYDMIQVGFYTPTHWDGSPDSTYIELIPIQKENDRSSLSEIQQKEAVVIGRLCELINSHFPEINQYTVFTK